MEYDDGSLSPTYVFMLPHNFSLGSDFILNCDDNVVML